MIVIKNNIIYSDMDKYVHRTGTDTYFKKAFELPGDDIEQFEEVDNIPNFDKIRYYPELVSRKIRVKYTQDDELAILRQRDEKPDEFKEYNDFAEKCKQEAKNEIEALPENWQYIGI